MYGDIAIIKKMTSIKFAQLNCANDMELDTLLTGWLTEFNSEINTRLIGGEIPDLDKRKPGLDGIANRLVMRMIGFALQQKSSPIVRINDFQIRTVNPSEVTKDLDMQLEPYQKPKLTIYDSADVDYGELL